MRAVNVWHIGAWNRNIGDWALAYQLHRLLREQGAPRNLTFSFYLVDSQRTCFHRGLVEQMNEEADLVLIGGGGLIFFRPEDKSVSGWSFNIEPRLLETIRKPIVVYAIGYNKFAFDSTPFPSATGPHLRQVQSQAALFSVRNNGTRRILIDEYQLAPEKLDVVPDPGICLFDRHLPIAAKHPARPVVALNWAGDRPQLRYPEPHEENAALFLSRVKEALLQCVKELQVQVMFLPHLLHIDSDMYDAFAAGFPEGSIFSTHREASYLYPPPGEMLYPHVPFFTNLFRQADLVMGMRFHTCVLSFGAGTRFVTLGSHPKLGFFAKDTGFTRHSVPLVDPKRETAGYIFDTIRSCLKDERYKVDVRSELKSQLLKLRAFNERLLDLVS